MFNIEIAGLVVTIENQYEYIKEKCLDYLTEKENDTGIVLAASEKMIENSIKYKRNFDGMLLSREEAEYDCIHYPLYKVLPRFDAFWLHSVLIEKDGVGYAFTAIPGGGKSTHARLWLKTFPDAKIINGDNTIIRKDSDAGLYYGYGTPFCGKEGYQMNKRVPMKAIAFVEKSDNNYTEKRNEMDSIMQMLRDNWCIEGKMMGMSMNLYTELVNQVGFYTIHCNMHEKAALIAYAEISKK